MNVSSSVAVLSVTIILPILAPDDSEIIPPFPSSHCNVGFSPNTFSAITVVQVKVYGCPGIIGVPGVVMLLTGGGRSEEEEITEQSGQPLTH